MHPEIVACVSAHAAVDKACDIMGLKLKKVPFDPVTFKCDTKALERAIGPNTIMLYSSAPGYPQGVIDDIVEMGRLATKYNIGLHVDCCLGGFILPFAKKLGYSIPDFDFSVKGVSSMSLDTHKYGYALKGSSVVLYRSKELRRAQYFNYPEWTGGIYTTPTIAGSRSGGLLAQTWASMMAMGESGYMKYTRDILETAKLIAQGVKSIQGLTILGATEVMIVCFAADKSVPKPIDIYAVGDCMTARGWCLNTLQHPASIHICCTVCHVGHHEEFLSDLRSSVEEIRSRPANAKEGKAAVYGMAASLPRIT